jgi:hypothetical protein
MIFDTDVERLENSDSTKTSHDVITIVNCNPILVVQNYNIKIYSYIVLNVNVLYCVHTSMHLPVRTISLDVSDERLLEDFSFVQSECREHSSNHEELPRSSSLSTAAG